MTILSWDNTVSVCAPLSVRATEFKRRLRSVYPATAAGEKEAFATHS